jgi:hypothetical protein
VGTRPARRVAVREEKVCSHCSASFAFFRADFSSPSSIFVPNSPSSSPSPPSSPRPKQPSRVLSSRSPLLPPSRPRPPLLRLRPRSTHKLSGAPPTPLKRLSMPPRYVRLLRLLSNNSPPSSVPLLSPLPRRRRRRTSERSGRRSGGAPAIRLLSSSMDLCPELRRRLSANRPSSARFDPSSLSMHWLLFPLWKRLLRRLLSLALSHLPRSLALLLLRRLVASTHRDSRRKRCDSFSRSSVFFLPCLLTFLPLSTLTASLYDGLAHSRSGRKQVGSRSEEGAFKAFHSALFQQHLSEPY